MAGEAAVLIRNFNSCSDTQRAARRVSLSRLIYSKQDRQASFNQSPTDRRIGLTLIFNRRPRAELL